MHNASLHRGGARGCLRLPAPSFSVLAGALALSLLACGNPLQPAPAPETGSEPITSDHPDSPGADLIWPYPIPEGPGGDGTDPGTPTDPGEPTGPETPPAQLPTCSGGVMAAFNVASNTPPGEGSGAYVVPGEAARVALRGSIDALLAGDPTGALDLATSAEYALCRGTGSESDLVLWRPPPGQGHAVVTLRTGAARPLILEAPHPLHDSKTVEESVVIFERTKARVLIASMTHRCANSEESGCSGTTDACGGSNPYKISDQAHTDQGMFHAAHVSLSEAFSQDLVMQIHGMARAGISVSNGTDASVDTSAPVARLAMALATSFSGVTTCNAFSGGTTESHLCGTTNTQGRHVNGQVMNACTSKASSPTHRFIHLEQNSSVRAQPEKVADAIATILP